MAITVGSVEVDVIPNTQGIYQRLRAGLVPAATRAGEDAGRAAGRAFGPAMQGSVGNIGLSLGQQIGRQIAARITAEIRGALRDGVTQGGTTARPAATRQGDETGGAFARAMKARLDAAFRSLPKANIRLSDTGVDADLARLRARMETLSNKRIGVDVDVAAADAEIADIEERLRRLGSSHPNVAVRADTAAARARLAEMRAEIARLTADPTRIRVETDGSFGQRLRAQVQAAQASLPNINIGADTSPAQAELVSLRAQLGALSDQRVGIDIDAAAATARIDEIRARLARLAATSPDVAVQVDAATAEAQLAQVAAIADAVDGKDIDLHVSNTEALSAIFQVAVAIAALAAIPAIPVLAAGAGSLVSAFTAAGVGVGVFAAAALPALTSIKGALDAQKQAQDAASTATAKGAQTAGQAAAKALQMAGAQQALASAERNAAQQIAEAQRGVKQAVEQAARANQQAAQQVKQAQQGVADAVQQAAERQQAAARAVADAEKQLAADQKAARQAQLDLTAARQAASDQLVDLNNQLKDSELSQRRAVLAVQSAQKQLNADKALGTKVSADQLAQDQLAYDEAVQALAEQQLQTKRLTDQTVAANKAGVEGSNTYKNAQDAVVQAQAKVADQTQTLKDAQASQAKTQVANARAIADAQTKLADAQRNIAVVQQQSAESVAQAQRRVVQAQQSAADSIASAQRQVESASISAAGGVDAAATAATKYQQALAKLSPSARTTFNAFVGLRTAFKKWSADLQPNIMPIFTRGINGAKNSLPGLTPIVLGASRGISTLQDMVSRGFKSPWWLRFKTDFAASVEPAIVGVGKALGNIFVGGAGIVDAFLAHIDGIGDRMDRVTGRFANFGKNLRGSPAFENFLSYASLEASKLADALGKVGTAFLNVAKAVAPLSGPVLAVLGGAAVLIGNIAESTPGAFQLIYALFIGMKLFTLATKAAALATVLYQSGVILATLLTEGWTAAIIASSAAFDANPIVVVITIIIAALALLVVGILYAWNHWAWFRDAVTSVWQAIQTAALWAWNNVLKPTFNAIALAAVWLYTNALKPAFDGVVAAFQAVARWAVWLWQTVLAPVFSVLGAIFGVWWAAVKIYFTAVITIFKMLAAIALWLWHQIMDPVFKALGAVFKLWWSGVKLYFAAVTVIFKALGDTATWLWRNAIRPVFQAIGDLGNWLWDKALRPAFNGMKTGIKAVGDSFVTAKDLISQQWSLVSDLAKKPVKFLIDTVYNKGITGIWNKVADIVDGPHLKPVKIKGFATGGITEGVRPGYTPGRDTHVIAVGGGEAIMRPEWTRALGSGYVDAMNAAARTGGVAAVRRAHGMPGYFGGGIIDTVTGAAKNVAGKVTGAIGTGIDWAKTGIDLIANPTKIFDKLTGPVRDLISKMGTSKWAKLIEGLPLRALDDLKDKVVSLVGLGGGGGGKTKNFHPSAGVAQWAPVILQALRLLDQSVLWLPTVERRMNQESGGNPRAVNLWDSNAKAGYPSTGLMQVIRPTFQHNAGPFRDRGPFMFGVSVDPLANTYAGLHYALGRYGSLSALNRPGGYDQGGWLMPGQLGFNGLSKPEAVLTPDQFEALAGAAKAGGNGGGVTYQINARTADFTVADLRLLQRQQETRQRVGRPT